MKIFMTGVTGYIGGSVAMALLQQGHHITGLTRDAKKAALLQDSGIIPIIGDLDDTTCLIEQAALADVVINTADSDHHGAIKALIEGSKGTTGKVLIHTSGSSVIGDDAKGDKVANIVFNEETPFHIEGEKKARHEIDQMVQHAATFGVRSMVLCNSMIYGEGLGMHKDSVQLPPLVKDAKAAGYVRIVGKGVNRWSNVHIHDVVSLYLLAIEKGRAGAFYFVENGEASFLDIATAITKRFQLEPIQSLSIEEATAQWGFGHAHYTFGSNSRVRSLYTRSELGWQPKYDSIVDWIEQEMPS